MIRFMIKIYCMMDEIFMIDDKFYDQNSLWDERYDKIYDQNLLYDGWNIYGWW
jgi:hypothetical protein